MPALYHRKWQAANPKPWLCYFCGGEIVFLLVHHIDGDHANDELSNLAGTHASCHMRHHVKDKPKTPEHREKLAAALRGRTLPEDVRKKISIGNKGKSKPPRTDEHKRKLGLAAKGRPVSAEMRAHLSRINKGRKQHEARYACECGMVTTARGLQIHQQASHHQGKELVSA